MIVKTGTNMKKGKHKINKKSFDTMKATMVVMKKAKVKGKDIATIMGVSTATLNKLDRSATYAEYKAIGDKYSKARKVVAQEAPTEQESIPLTIDLLKAIRYEQNKTNALLQEIINNGQATKKLFR